VAYTTTWFEVTYSISGDLSKQELHEFATLCQTRRWLCLGSPNDAIAKLIDQQTCCWFIEYTR
jgi:hypothetical protein